MKRTSNATTMHKKEIDPEGYKRLNDQLADLKHKLSDIRSQILAIRGNDGTNLAESPSFLFLVGQESGVLNEINELERYINTLVVVQKESNSEIVGIGDHVTLEVTYSADDTEIKTFILVSTSPDILKNEISKDSAIGQFIFGKAIGIQGNVELPNKTVANVKIISKE